MGEKVGAEGRNMDRFRNYWAYSIGLAIAWAIVLALTWVIRGADGIGTVLLVFLGFCIGWASTTIARYIYPPPKGWTLNQSQA
jgi:hypothetical protein